MNNETFVVIEFGAGHESTVRYAGNNKMKAEEVCRPIKDESRIFVWVNGEVVRWYDID